ncbi:MAG: class I SAM-dependent rRNA methyltransferase, partial [Myxococcales bacterium]
MAYLKLNLAKDLARHLRAGHPWVYKHALQTQPKIPAGSIVDIVDHGRFVARGYYDPYSNTAVRVLSRREDEVIDPAFFRRRVHAAVQRRKALLDLRDT